ncbi:MAG: JAB domain-containing protein, partial [Bacteroidota bacterium]
METRYWDAIPEIQVSYKRPKNKCPALRNSQDSYEAFLLYWDMDLIDYVDAFKILLLSNANHILGVVHLSKGGIAGVVVDIRVIFGIALKAAACSIIAAHNHPSG